MLTTAGPPPGTMGRLAFAAALGSFFEYYDFFIATVAAGVAWPAVFFSGQTASMALALSILTYAVTFFSRPLGAYIFGQIGDKFGRRVNVVWTLTLMGAGSFGIAILPSAASIGFAAPILLGCLRLVQGFGLGGEVGGASTWVIEVGAKSKWRGFWASWVQAGSPAGLTMASLLMYLAQTYTGSAFLNYGWRIPFALGAVVVVIGGIIRYKVNESPIFVKLRQERKIPRFPASQVLKKEWKKLLLFAPLVLPEFLATSVQVVPFTVVYMIQLHVPATFATFTAAYLGIGAFCSTVVTGILCDIYGRKIFWILGAVFAIVFAYTFFLAINTANTTIIALALLGWGFGSWLENGVIPCFFAESFESKYRISGSGLGYQFGALASGLVVGFALPAVIAGQTTYAAAWPSVAGITIAGSILALISSLLVKETKDVDVTL